MQNIRVNGEVRAVQEGGTLAELLRSLKVDPEGARGVAVAVNDEVVRRADWAGVVLADGDRIEVITARQGG